MIGLIDVIAPITGIIALAVAGYLALWINKFDGCGILLLKKM